MFNTCRLVVLCDEASFSAQLSSKLWAGQARWGWGRTWWGGAHPPFPEASVTACLSLALLGDAVFHCGVPFAQLTRAH